MIHTLTLLARTIREYSQIYIDPFTNQIVQWFVPILETAYLLQRLFVDRPFDIFFLLRRSLVGVLRSSGFWDALANNDIPVGY